AVSWIIFAVFSLVIFCSSAFIMIHADHDCTGEDCSVCMELAQCHKALQSLGTASGALWLALMLCAAVGFCVTVARSRSAHTTLISLKVELLN
ncbi:MAG: hypothetical protein IJ080_08010, partial [Oscillospiraceae bacterium]|nr:hypothetical protein [Oscillospiraceae bacterium]